MKNLVYIIYFLCLFSCVDKRNIEQLKMEVKSDLDRSDKILHKTAKEFLEKEVEDFKITISRNNAKVFFANLKYAKNIEKKYLNIWNSISKNKTNKQCQNIYTKYHKLLIDELRTKPKIWKRLKPYLHTLKSLPKIDSPFYKERIQLQMSENIVKVFEQIFYEGLSSCMWFSSVLCQGNTKSQQVEEGKDIELSQFVYYTTKQIYKMNRVSWDIDKGFLKANGRVQHISIPTQKLGTQEFTVILNMKNWETNKDTTLYFTKTFEVIE